MCLGLEGVPPQANEATFREYLRDLRARQSLQIRTGELGLRQLEEDLALVTEDLKDTYRDPEGLKEAWDTDELDVLVVCGNPARKVDGLRPSAHPSGCWRTQSMTMCTRLAGSRFARM
jgi:hypothetical protein